MADQENQAMEEEHFYEVLAGRTQGHAWAEALRDALEAEARTLQEAEDAHADDLSVRERSQMDAIKQQLIDQGAFASPTSTALDRHREQTRRKTSSNNGNQILPNKLLELLFGHNWQRPIVIAASLLVATVVVMQTLPQGRDDVESNAIRGKAEASIAVDDPALAAKSLKDQLVSIGAEVILVQINDDEWAIQVGMGKESNQASVKQLVRDKGFVIHGEMPYDLVLRRQRR